MAIEVKVLKVGSDVLTDLQPGKTRRTIYTPAGQLGPMMAFLLGLGAAVIPTGVARAFTGTSPRAKAREELEDDLLAAEITGAQQKADFLMTQRRLLERGFDPVSEEERALKLQGIRNALGFAVQHEEIDLEAERTKAARGDELYALALQEREQALGIQEQLRNERAERQTEFIATERAKRELAAEESDRRDRLIEQKEKDKEEAAIRAWMDAPIGGTPRGPRAGFGGGASSVLFY